MSIVNIASSVEKVLSSGVLEDEDEEKELLEKISSLKNSCAIFLENNNLSIQENRLQQIDRTFFEVYDGLDLMRANANNFCRHDEAKEVETIVHEFITVCSNFYHSIEDSVYQEASPKRYEIFRGSVKPIGIVNLDSKTCAINSAIQVLYTNPDLRNKVLSSSCETADKSIKTLREIFFRYRLNQLSLLRFEPDELGFSGPDEQDLSGPAMRIRDELHAEQKVGSLEQVLTSQAQKINRDSGNSCLNVLDQLQTRINGEHSSFRCVTVKTECESGILRVSLPEEHPFSSIHTEEIVFYGLKNIPKEFFSECITIYSGSEKVGSFQFSGMTLAQCGKLISEPRSGHGTAIIRSSDNQFFLANDNEVTDVTLEEFTEELDSGKTFDSCMSFRKIHDQDKNVNFVIHMIT